MLQGLRDSGLRLVVDCLGWPEKMTEKGSGNLQNRGVSCLLRRRQGFAVAVLGSPARTRVLLGFNPSSHIVAAMAWQQQRLLGFLGSKALPGDFFHSKLLSEEAALFIEKFVPIVSYLNPFLIGKVINRVKALIL